jgi:hypothetical protein
MTLLQKYLLDIQQGVHGSNLTERSYYPVLKSLLEDLGDGEIVATVESRRIACGADVAEIQLKEA